jgi:hypothetical protein
MSEIKTSIEQYNYLEKSDILVYSALISECQKFVELNPGILNSEISEKEKEEILKNLQKLKQRFERLAYEKHPKDMSNSFYRLLKNKQVEKLNVYKAVDQIEETKKRKELSLTEQTQEKVIKAKRDIFDMGSRAGERRLAQREKAEKKRERLKKREEDVENRRMQQFLSEYNKEEEDEISKNKMESESRHETKEDVIRKMKESFESDQVETNSVLLEASVDFNALTRQNDDSDDPDFVFNENIRQEVVDRLDSEKQSIDCEYQKNKMDRANKKENDSKQKYNETDFVYYTDQITSALDKEIEKDNSLIFVNNKIELQDKKYETNLSKERKNLIFKRLSNKLESINERKLEEQRKQKQEMRKVNTDEQMGEILNKIKKNNQKCIQNEKLEEIVIPELNVTKDKQGNVEAELKTRKINEQEKNEHFKEKEEEIKRKREKRAKQKGKKGYLGYLIGFLGLVTCVAIVCTFGLGVVQCLAAGAIGLTSLSFITNNYNMNKNGTYDTKKLFCSVGNDLKNFCIPTIKNLGIMIKDGLVEVGKAAVFLAKKTVKLISMAYQKIIKILKSIPIPNFLKQIKDIGVVSSIIGFLKNWISKDFVPNKILNLFELGVHNERKNMREAWEIIQTENSNYICKIRKCLRENDRFKQLILSLIYFREANPNHEQIKSLEWELGILKNFDHENYQENLKTLQLANPKIKFNPKLIQQELHKISQEIINGLKEIKPEKRLRGWEIDLSRDLSETKEFLLARFHKTLYINHPEILNCEKTRIKIVNEVFYYIDTIPQKLIEQFHKAKVYKILLREDSDVEIIKMVKKMLDLSNTKYQWLKNIYHKSIKKFCKRFKTKWSGLPKLFRRNHQKFVEDSVAKFNDYVLCRVYSNLIRN